MSGPYDDGYRNCSCFWGSSPGSLTLKLETLIDDFHGLDVLDAGCGEAKNAAYLAKKGARVFACDCSELAIKNASGACREVAGVTLAVADITSLVLPEAGYDVVIAYGLLHCLDSASSVKQLLSRLQSATRTGGYLLLCAFNARSQDLSAHPGFTPLLLPHDWYVGEFSSWHLIHCSDSDLYETHPHNGIPHHHSLTRIIARK